MSLDIRAQLQKTLGDSYRLDRELGGGGMSQVFVADELRLDRKVVVKVLSPDLAQGISVERFEREIKTVAALQQANIVPVLTAGDTNGLPYYTMPFVEGESLRAHVARGPLSITESVSIMKDVAKALAYAHQRGVVHRDIKPDNVLLSGGTAVVTDFGIAKAISAARTSSGASATLTQIGTSIGTPAYMAPEQAAGDPDVDHRADIYSLGAMIYELLGGQAVFAGRTPQRVLAAHMSEVPVTISDLRADVPVALAELIMSCLAKEPGKRPQSAGDIVRALESITSGGGMQSMPPILIGGPAMFRKALVIYAGAFVIVAILAKAAIVGIGLPDWVFPGSLIVMALGLPVVLWTGYVQRVTRRAMAQTPTYTPGGTPSLTHGTIATMALKAAPHVSWYKTARGGAYAFGAFIFMIGAFMAMRAFGIGPFGSLIATGALKARDRVIISDFAVNNADSSLGRVVGDAIRAGLGDSRVFTLMSPAEIAAALQRLQQPPTARVPLALARQIALREGVKAIVDGDVTLVDKSYIIVARLVTADSGRELVSYRGTASGSDAIINVADDLSRKLRAKAGESLRQVAATPALAYASTSSLDALRKYSDATRANDVERDYMKAIRLLHEALALDSNFAEAWRKLAVSTRNSRAFPASVADSAARRAFLLSPRMTERERDAVLAYYYSGSPGYDLDKAAATYQRMLARGDSTVALNNLGGLYRRRRRFAEADTMFSASVRLQPDFQGAWMNLLNALGNEVHLKAHDSAFVAAREHLGATTSLTEHDIFYRLDLGHFDDVLKSLDSARKKGDAREPTWARNSLAYVYYLTGRLRDADRLTDEVAAADSAAGRATTKVDLTRGKLIARIASGMPVDAALKAFDESVETLKIDAMPVTDRPYLDIANVYARVGRPDRAKVWIAKYDAGVRDTALRRWDTPNLLHAQGHVAAAEKKWNEAAELMRKGDAIPNNAGPCDYCVGLEITELYADAGMADSALAGFARYRKTPWGSRALQGPDDALGASLTEALAKIFDSKGDTENAVRLYRDFIEMWKNADPELQPRVTAARARLAKLTPVEKPK